MPIDLKWSAEDLAVLLGQGLNERNWQFRKPVGKPQLQMFNVVANNGQQFLVTVQEVNRANR